MGSGKSKQSATDNRDSTLNETKIAPVVDDDLSSEESPRASRTKYKKKKVEDEHANVLVIDNGSHSIKAGFCGDSSPRGVFPPIVGTPRIAQNDDDKRIYVGDAAQSKRGILRMHYAFKNGVVDDWTQMEAIWKHAFYNELRISPEDHPLFLTETVFNSKGNREKTAEIIFEKFQMPSLYLADTASCCMTASGRTTGIALECGYETSSAVPIYEGHVLKSAACSMDIGGKHVTDYLITLLGKKGYALSTSADREIMNGMKKQLGFVALDYNEECVKAETSGRLSKSYELPDGQVLDHDSIKMSRFQCTECLFQPSMIGTEAVGVAKLLECSIRGCAEHMMDMCSNVIVSGGTTNIDGFAERVQRDLSGLINANDERLTAGYIRLHNVAKQTMANDIVEVVHKHSPTIKIKCMAPPGRTYSVWTGASVLVTVLPQDMWISKHDYSEYGANILNTKCV